MKWLTTEHIQAEAKKGRRQALECSIEHWEQLAGATYRELVYGMCNGKVAIHATYCAFCSRYFYAAGVGKGCKECPLRIFQKATCGGGQWWKVREVIDSDRGNYIYPSKEAYPAFHREAKKMAKVLKDVHKKLYGKGKK